ncbi:MAG: hypothetical protein HOP22_06040 [Nitrospiraceae bacterium]|nr:hypothetical protein [Nitrospiraceae bacterium]
MPVFNRKQSPSGSTKAAVRLSNDTLEGLEEIRRLFRLRFPLAKFPTLSACLDLALRRYLEEVGDDPKSLRAEVLLFKERYQKEEPR